MWGQCFSTICLFVFQMIQVQLLWSSADGDAIASKGKTDRASCRSGLLCPITKNSVVKLTCPGAESSGLRSGGN